MRDTFFSALWFFLLLCCSLTSVAEDIPDSWTYIEIDSTRSKWGDWSEPEWMKYFGLAMMDVTGDGYRDIVSGRYFYRNPGGDMTDTWERIDFGLNVDGMLFVDVDGDNYGDIIAEALPDVYWLEAQDSQGGSWKARKICSIPKTNHVNGQGYKLAQIVQGGKPEILLSSGNGIYCIEIPVNPSDENWPVRCIAPEATEEGIGTGDIDGDGDIDIAAGSGEKKGDGMTVSWWENPGKRGTDWKRHNVGETIRFADRVEIADINGDRKPDVIVTEERWPEPEDVHVFWFEQPGVPEKSGWIRHTIAVQNTTNNLDIADMDGDGDIDIITAEHRGTKKLQIWENNSNGAFWKEHIVSSGRESHLGARVADMDNDGDLDIISIAWDDHKFLHLWRNDSLSGSTGNSKGVCFREYWAEWDKKVSNRPGRLRVNDQNVSLDENWGKRNEALANGLMLVNVPEYLFHLESAELYLELWGGHPHTENKRFIVNGKKWYHIPKTGTENGHCTYSYPVIPLNVGHLVNGINAFQFTCERGAGFWGHYIIDNAAVRCYIPSDHPDIITHGLKDFSAQIKLPGDDRTIMDRTRLFLSYDVCFEKSILSVEYFGRFPGFDDNGNTIDDDWHGFTFGREFVNHIGETSEPPFEVLWDTIMIPGRGSTMAVKALVRLTGGINYWTPVVDGLVFPGNRSGVMMFKCSEMPVPFWSRASHEKKAIIRLPDRLDSIARAQLLVKMWDGGEGTVKEPFKINGFPYSIVSGKHIHDVVFTRVDIMQEHLKSGDNELTLLSDTEHHGIEMLLPGPCFIIRYK